jgi:hypothetical protein
MSWLDDNLPEREEDDQSGGRQGGQTNEDGCRHPSGSCSPDGCSAC